VITNRGHQSNIDFREKGTDSSSQQHVALVSSVQGGYNNTSSNEETSIILTTMEADNMRTNNAILNLSNKIAELVNVMKYNSPSLKKGSSNALLTSSIDLQHSDHSENSIVDQSIAISQFFCQSPFNLSTSYIHEFVLPQYSTLNDVFGAPTMRLHAVSLVNQLHQVARLDEYEDFECDMITYLSFIQFLKLKPESAWNISCFDPLDFIDFFDNMYFTHHEMLLNTVTKLRTIAQHNKRESTLQFRERGTDSSSQQHVALVSSVQGGYNNTSSNATNQNVQLPSQHVTRNDNNNDNGMRHGNHNSSSHFEDITICTNPENTVGIHPQISYKDTNYNHGSSCQHSFISEFSLDMEESYAEQNEVAEEKEAKQEKYKEQAPDALRLEQPSNEIIDAIFDYNIDPQEWNHKEQQLSLPDMSSELPKQDQLASIVCNVPKSVDQSNILYEFHLFTCDPNSNAPNEDRNTNINDDNTSNVRQDFVRQTDPDLPNTTMGIFKLGHEMPIPPKPGESTEPTELNKGT
jgi:hypothetical protein